MQTVTLIKSVDPLQPQQHFLSDCTIIYWAGIGRLIAYEIEERIDQICEIQNSIVKISKKIFGATAAVVKNSSLGLLPIICSVGGGQVVSYIGDHSYSNFIKSSGYICGGIFMLYRKSTHTNREILLDHTLKKKYFLIKNDRENTLLLKVVGGLATLYGIERMVLGWVYYNDCV